VKRSRPASLALVGLFLWVSACTSYKHVDPPFAGHKTIRVTKTDGSDWNLSQPRLEADSLIGKLDHGGWVAIPIDQVADTWVGGTNEEGTIGVIVLVFAGIALAGLVALSLADPIQGG